MICPLDGHRCPCRRIAEECQDDSEEGCDAMTIEEANREESRWIDRQNARDINRKIS